ncbi:hypothetical protein JQS43_16690 [Natronosporangium hydrolyticum]|uniref:Uncharacterized protein n=1 Tax=Natronosporangium hydrolyticum TaxID=2811111 RepID=A0A895YD20_9ACTN|nr:hypothetical protein [Natronosporangium hydrolyticum]QSB13259.1 hypothetical protein JQS43_16690 [Natronosporangium hydrolyticum]
MTLLASLAQAEVTEYAEPYDTIAAVAILLLLLVYLAGLPATVAVAAMHWRHRSRPRSARPTSTAAPPTTVPPMTVPPPTRPPPTVPATRFAPGPAAPPVAPAPLAAPPPAAGGAAGAALLQLQALEREVLALLETPAAAPWQRLAQQTAELVSRHGADPTLGPHAVGLRAVVAALAPLRMPAAAITEPPVVPLAAPTGELPASLRVGLCRLAAEGRPIPPQWAFAWYGHLWPRWPTEVDQRIEEIRQAFTARYQATYPHGGMILALVGGTLEVNYPPISARYGGRPIRVASSLPDVTAIPDPLRRLRAVGGAALAELRPPVTPPASPTGSSGPSR